MDFTRIERDASACLTAINTEQAAIAKRIRALDTSIRALGDHDAVSLLRDEMTGLKAEAFALGRHIVSVKGLLAASKSCTATVVKNAEAA